jgi:N-ethylmaleimide reductase
MTRDRSAADGTPTAMNVAYYTQRASMALIITEGTQPSEDGQGYLLTPGVHTAAQIAGWGKSPIRSIRPAAGSSSSSCTRVGWHTPTTHHTDGSRWPHPRLDRRA